MRREKHVILGIVTLLCISAAVVFVPNTIASHTTIGTLNYLDTQIYQVTGNLTLIFNNSDTGTQDITVTNLGYVSATNKTVFQVVSHNITYNWTFVNNTKTYNYFDITTMNTYTVNVNYQAIHVPKSPYQLLREMLEAKNATIISLSHMITQMNNTINNLTRNMTLLKNMNTNLSALANQTVANNTPLHMQIVNLSSEIDRLNASIISLTNANTFMKTNISAAQTTINELRNPWCLGYTFNDVGYLYLNAASMVILFVILLIVGAIVIYRQKIKTKGKQVIKDITTTSQQSKRETTGFMDEQVRDFETNFLKNENITESIDTLSDLKNKDPVSYKKAMEKLHRDAVDKIETPSKK